MKNEFTGMGKKMKLKSHAKEKIQIEKKTNLIMDALVTKVH